MQYKFKENDKALTVFVEGRIDTMTTPELEEAVLKKMEQFDSITFDFRDLEYISSAGLRLLLLVQKKATATNKDFKIERCNQFVLEVFEMTGFSDILNVK